MTNKVKTTFPGFIQYDIDITHLSNSEQELVESLVEVAKLVGPLYKKQENPNFSGENFYPRDITERDLVEANKSDPSILSNYTVVKKDATGKLYSVPYHEEYKEDYAKIEKQLGEALKTCKKVKGYDRLAQYLENLIKTFRGEMGFDEVMKYFVASRGTNVDFLLGPMDGYIDGLMNKKYAFDCNVRITSRQKHYTDDFIEITLKTVPSGGLITEEDLSDLDMYIRIDDVVCYAGSDADFITSGANYPNTFELAKKYGLKITVYTTGIRYKLFEGKVDVLNTVFSSRLRREYTNEELLQGATRALFLHEIAETVMKFRYDFVRFHDNHFILKEILADMTSLKVLGIHMLTGATTDRDLRATIFAYMIRCIVDYILIKDSMHNMPYALGRSIFIKRVLDQKAMYKRPFGPGKYYIDFYKAYKIIEGLAEELEVIVASGDNQKASEYLQANADLKAYKAFDSLLYNKSK